MYKLHCATWPRLKQALWSPGQCRGLTPGCCSLAGLQEALTKAAGKKSKTPVQLDLGDMLAALEKHQQAMKARQLTNTKPLSFTGTRTGKTGKTD